MRRCASSRRRPGEIVVGDLTHRITAAGVGYGAAREIEAKGIGRLGRVAGRDASSATCPNSTGGCPGCGPRSSAATTEASTLVQAFEGVAKDGRPHLLTVYGPAGSGKSRLTTEFFAAIGGARVRAGALPALRRGHHLLRDPAHRPGRRRGSGSRIRATSRSRRSSALRANRSVTISKMRMRSRSA